MNSFKLFLTYGDEKFPKSRARIVEQASALEIFDDCLAETHETIARDDEWKEALKNEQFSKASKEHKGGGFYMWKPYIIYKHLHTLTEGDVLIYADAGLTIPAPGAGPWRKKNHVIEKFQEYFYSLKVSREFWYAVPFLGTDRWPKEERVWTKMDTLDYFNCLDNKTIINSPQLQGGRHIIKKCDRSIEIAKSWWETVKSHPHLCDNSPSKMENCKKFIEHRNDQSIFSIIAKLNGVSEAAPEDFPILRTRIHE